MQHFDRGWLFDLDIRIDDFGWTRSELPSTWPEDGQRCQGHSLVVGDSVENVFVSTSVSKREEAPGP